MKPLSIVAVSLALLILCVSVFTLEYKFEKPYFGETNFKQKVDFSTTEQFERGDQSFDVLFALTFIKKWLGANQPQEEEEERTQPSPFRAVFGVYLLIKN